MRKQLYILFIAIFSISCNTVEKMVERGQYDEAFAYSVRQLAGKSKKKTKYVTALEEAYVRLNERDLNEIEFLLGKGSPASWDRIYNLYEKLETRQNLVIPLMPLRSKDGYIAHFDTKDYRENKIEVANLSAKYHYDKANYHLDFARKGDKRAARRAMTSLNNIEKYFIDYKDSDLLKNEAREIGTEHIAVEFTSNDNWFLGEMAIRNIATINLNSFDSYWEKFHHYDGNSAYDNYIVIELDRVDVGNERELVNHSSFSKEIEDGYDIIEKTVIIKKDKKESGKGKNNETIPANSHEEVKKEIVKKVKYITVRADVVEIKREKTSNLYGSIKVFTNGIDHPTYENLISVDFGFRDEAVKLNGDRRALPENICVRLDDFISDFPSDFVVVDELTYNFKSAIGHEVHKYDFLYD